GEWNTAPFPDGPRLGRVYHDAHDPGLEGGASLKPIEPAQHTEPGLLHHFLRDGRVGDVHPGQPQQRGLVALDQHHKGRLITLAQYSAHAVYVDAARSGTALEIDGDPTRLDLRDVQARAAVAAGCMVSVDSDAHAPEGLDNMAYGVGVAQRAWVPQERVLNAL